MTFNPLDPSTYPRTGNPYIDSQLQQGVVRAGQSLIASLPPDLQQAVGTVAAAVSASRQPAVAQNPISGPTGEVGEFVARLKRAESGVFLVLGRKGAGKSTISFKIGQLYADDGRQVFVVGVKQHLLRALGPNFHQLQPEDIATVPNGSVIILDDAGLFFGQHDYGQDASKLLEDLLSVVRHKDIILIANMHNSRRVNVYLIEADVYFMKPTSLLEKRAGGRRELLDLQQRADAALKPFDDAAVKSRVFVFSEVLGYEGLLQYTPPRGWSQKLSKNKG